MAERKWFAGLQGKLLLWFLALALIPLLVVSVISYMNAARSLREGAFNRLKAV